MTGSRAQYLAAAIVSMSVMAGCGSGTGVATGDGATDGGDPASLALPDKLADSLNLLGVATEPSPRIGNDGVALPEDFSPFGHRLKIASDDAGHTRIGAPMEWILGGFTLRGAADSFVVLDNLAMPDSGPDIAPSPILSLGALQARWAREDGVSERVPPVTLRDAVGGDLDGDGHDELIVAHSDSGQLRIHIADLAHGASTEESFVVAVPSDVLPIGDVRVAAGDFDADGRSEIVASISQVASPGRPTRTALLALAASAGNLVVRHARIFQSTLASDVHASTVLEPGNVDYDAADEIVLVLNEFVGTRAIPDQAATRAFVLDDARHDFAERLADTLSVVTSSATYHAQVADIAIGDLDGDWVNEIVFGGLADLTVAPSCNQDADGNPGTLRYLLLVYDFTGQGIARTQTAFSSDADGGQLYPGYCKNSPADRAIRFLQVNVLDFDNDREPDIQANQFVFTGIPEHGRAWQSAGFVLPQPVIMPDENVELVFDRNSARIVVRDVDGNGRDDIVSYRGGDEAIRLYGWHQGLDGSGAPSGPPDLIQLARIPVETVDPSLTIRPGQNANPILVALDADGSNEGDVQTLQFLRHEFALTEPLVLAAIAAPPCGLDIGQNTEACTSSWGNAQIQGTDAEREISFKAGIIAGFEVEYQAGAGFVVDASTKVFGLSAKLALSEELAWHRSESYEVTRSVSFETGPMEDSVVFVSTPYDFYVYEVIASTRVNMEDIGAEREVHRLGLPRTPVIRMSEAGYYNAHTTASALKIDAAVFQHSAGRVDSYPDRWQRDEILRARRTQLDEIRLDCPGCWQVDPDEPARSGNNPWRQFAPLDALPGLVTDVVGVGQGRGATEVALDFSRNSSYGNSLAKSAELEVELTVGAAVFGVALGGGVSHSTSVTHGQSTAYVGTVGSIDAANFAARQYRFGMFTYLQADPQSGQEFEVINYWVE
ncbi:FG-GAP-like repeat-containing protein [Zeimonas arvi]|uniref:VCBS repeat-containing protein n=1 Tax=Zeimonas arvi TaxID=2498847 RepID=A0A5C8NUJ3_9BURK|nr:FG-GAP-like repeat-containing protein [Zeimonas arvi]TXL64772.1 hypothetical protein FHP08_13630 [Zeimonas arvi]